MNEDLTEALNILDELGGVMAAENCPLAHVLLAEGLVVEGEPDKFGRKTITRPKKNQGGDRGGFLSDIIEKLQGTSARVGFDMETTDVNRDWKPWEPWESSNPCEEIKLSVQKNREPRYPGQFFIGIDYAQLEMRILGQAERDKKAQADGRCCSWDTDNDGECPRHTLPQALVQTGRMSDWESPWTRHTIAGFAEVGKVRGLTRNMIMVDDHLRDLTNRKLKLVRDQVRKPKGVTNNFIAQSMAADYHAELAAMMAALYGGVGINGDKLDAKFAKDVQKMADKIPLEDKLQEVAKEQELSDSLNNNPKALRRLAKTVSFAFDKYPEPRANFHLSWNDFVERIQDEIPKGGNVHIHADSLGATAKVQDLAGTLDRDLVLGGITITHGRDFDDLREANIAVELNPAMNELKIIKSRSGHTGDTVSLPR